MVSRITRQADESAVEGEAKEVSGRHYAGSVENGGAVNEDARFFGGLFGKNESHTFIIFITLFIMDL